ncbi:MAG TPA: TRAP transporter TatT component family protein [Steroidobacteraceae bacterium]|nr:TRAP transporter TatT component family protein [Steroidobacteraceae bacterium]
MPRAAAGAAVLVLLAAASGCSVQRFAADKLADTLAASGTTYAADEDPELVAEALPFSLKLMESVLASTPEHRGLLAATCAGFTQYAWAFVQQDADAVALEDSDRAWDSWNRARRLYLRARDYCLRGFDAALPGFSAELRAGPATAVARAAASEMDLLYWTAASWAAAISLGKDDPELVAELPVVSALIDRALVLEEGWDRGAVHAFLVAYSMVRPDIAGDRETVARRHFDRAIELAQGRSAGPHLSWAESYCLPHEDRACFEQSLQAALAIDADAEPATRLANTVMQRRAAWLLAHADHWILPPLEDEEAARETTP